MKHHFLGGRLAAAAVCMITFSALPAAASMPLPAPARHLVSPHRSPLPWSPLPGLSLVAAQKRAAQQDVRREARAVRRAWMQTLRERRRRRARLAALARQRALAGAARPAPPPPPAGSWQAIVRSMAAPASASCAIAIFARESGGNPYAVNPSSGAYGIPQALPGSKMASAGADWRTNPATQIRWGLGYMTARYGSPCGAWAFWQAHGWY